MDYEACFTNFKGELLNSTALYYPDYDRTWYLRVEAPEDSVGFELLQDKEGIPFKPGNSMDPLFEPLLFGSKKFSKQAKNGTCLAKRHTQCITRLRSVNIFCVENNSYFRVTIGISVG